MAVRKATQRRRLHEPIERAGGLASNPPMTPTASAGYSGKPVWQKLGLAVATRVLVRHAPVDYAEMVELDEAKLTLTSPRAAFDLAHVFVVSATSLKTEIAALAKRLPGNGVIWISWPKKSAKVATDVTEGTVRAVALALGLVDVKVCAIDAVWSGLKLVWRREQRAGKS